MRQTGTSPAMTLPKPEQRHRRQVYTAIVLPAAGALLLLVVLLALAIGLLNPLQFGMIADLMAIMFILVPWAIICLIPTLILMAAALGFWGVHGNIARPLARLRQGIIGQLAIIRREVPGVSEPVIALQHRLAYWERLLSVPRARRGEEKRSDDR